MLYALTITIASFLLFQVQLILGKRLLPWYGGAPAVWTTCLLFFQVLLLGGYAYAHWLSTRFAIRRQQAIHFALSALALGLIGVLTFNSGFALIPGETWKPASPEAPLRQLLLTLLVHVALPFFLLAGTSPLLQRWAARRSIQSERSYRLYALSNAGSLAGLLTYPFIFEPLLGLKNQSIGWTVGFGGFVTALAALVANGQRAVRAELERPEASDAPAPKMWERVCWVLLAATGTAALLSVTNEICQEVAVVPFLWVLPLALYLISFILCFDSPHWYQRRFWLLGTFLVSLAVLITAFIGLRLPIPYHVASYGIFLLFFCMVCHGELVRLRPAAPQATLFYLHVAAGGALGGVFVGIVAPIIFSSYWEFHVTLLGGWILFAIILGKDRRSMFFTGDRWAFALTLFGALLATSQLAVRLAEMWEAPELSASLRGPVQLLGAAALTVIVAVLCRNASWARSKYWPRILVGMIIFWAECFLLYRVRSTKVNTIAVERNFYGVARVQMDRKDPSLPLKQLSHGRILHGLQIQHADFELAANTYYSPNSGLGLAFLRHPRRAQATNNEPMRVGITGLGTGAITAYALAGDFFRFYEINPAVVKFARGPTAHFTYLEKCPAETSVVLGDARLSLEQELKSTGGMNYDLMVLDAFSSDAIPMHLLTLEALQMYLRHLRDENSVIAVNISNRFLDMVPVLMAATEKLQLHGWFIHSTGDFPFGVPANWVLISRRADLIPLESGEARAAPFTGGVPEGFLWTDDYSNLLRVLRF